MPTNAKKKRVVTNPPSAITAKPTANAPVRTNNTVPATRQTANNNDREFAKMKWTFDNYKHYSTEHMQKAEKKRLAEEVNKDQLPQRKGVLGTRRRKTHNL